MAIKKEVKSFIIGTAAGAAIGAVTALLFAPKPGKELRKDIADGAQHAYEVTAKTAGQVGESTVRIAKQVGSQTVELAGRAKEAVSGVVGTVTSLRSKSAATVEEEAAGGVEAEAEAGTEQKDTITAVS
jgi:gas vesicle protein